MGFPKNARILRNSDDSMRHEPVNVKGFIFITYYHVPYLSMVIAPTEYESLGSKKQIVSVGWPQSNRKQLPS